MKIFKKLKEQYEQITWKKITSEYCNRLKGAKMGLGERVTPRQDDPSPQPPEK
jgi:hypothetical protein